MKALEDTQERRSVVTHTLQSLSVEASQWRERIDQLEAGQPVDRAAAAAALTRLLDLSQNLRDAILSEDSSAEWSTRTELDALVARLDETASKRRKILELATRLTSGTVVHRRERTREERLRERDAAVSELMERSAQPQTPELPGPDVPQWIEWACNLDDTTGGLELAILARDFPRLDDFIRQLEIEMWNDDPGADTSIHSTNGHTATIIEIPLAHAPAPQPVLEPVPEPVLESTSELALEPAAEPSVSAAAVAETLPEVHAEAAPAAVEPPAAAPQIVEAILPEPEIQVAANGFFPADEVERLALHAARARRDPHAPRNVRALVAASHWISPWDQCPLLYPGGGIVEDIGNTGKPAVGPASPAEAAELLAASTDLQFFTGGADLLRWSLESAGSDRADAVAGVRRLSEKQIKHWFGDVFKIELAEPQVQDMYRLTYGIPLLVGELHRRVVPMHDTPPTWLGYAIWTRVKLAFDQQLPILAQELRDGHPSVRLTEREIALLKMVVEASDNSTAETLAANLMENWHTYRRPELVPVSSADETSLQLLVQLGLLPVAGETSGRIVKTLQPVEIEDPLRQLVSYL